MEPGQVCYGRNLASIRPSDSLPCGPRVLLCISISGRWGIRCSPSTVQAFQLHGGAHILISHLATVGQFAKSSQDDHLLGQSWQCDVANVYWCANLVGEWYSMPLCQSPACLCTFHSMCSFALLSNLCMVGWGAASPRGADVICYEIQDAIRWYQMLWDAIRCYCIWWSKMLIYDDVIIYMLFDDDKIQKMMAIKWYKMLL